MTSLCVDACYASLNKKNEELCGDRVQIVKSPEDTLLVLSDGLGSGVKANILSTLTSKIISTMISEGASIEDTVDTIAHTLPVCKVRGLAYSTFMILRVASDGSGYLVEYDNPPCILMRGGRHLPFDYNEKNIAGKQIRECRFTAQPGDSFVIVSDGVTQAGMGETLSFGWGWKSVCDYLERTPEKTKTSPELIQGVLGVCKDLYCGKPGDDTTVSVLHVMRPQTVALFSGPPKDQGEDKKLVEDYMNVAGPHIVCGGTSSQILARELGRELKVNLDFSNLDIPPTASIEGIDLVTEGVLTIKKVLELMDEYMNSPASQNTIDEINAPNGASQLAKMLIDKCTNLQLFIGKAVNPAHSMGDFPTELRVKSRLLDDLAAQMQKMGRTVEKNYY
ncbi:MAG: SpoIIE family protein phosphatase [Synergistaceae bacterium]|nr:SpoIIE family protein phosphatase [Synergistaceae bacterium]